MQCCGCQVYVYSWSDWRIRSCSVQCCGCQVYTEESGHAGCSAVIVRCMSTAGATEAFSFSCCCTFRYLWAWIGVDITKPYSPSPSLSLPLSQSSSWCRPMENGIQVCCLVRETSCYAQHINTIRRSMAASLRGSNFQPYRSSTQPFLHPSHCPLPWAGCHGCREPRATKVSLF